MNPASLIFAASLLIASMVCLTVLATKGLIPAADVSHLVSTLVGGVLGLLSPSIVSKLVTSGGASSASEKVS